MCASKGDWQRVTKQRPCPVCGKPDWCVYAGPDDAPEAVLCQRIKSDRRIGEAGWLHVLRDSATAWPRWRSTFRRAVRLATETKPEAPALDFGKLAAEAQAATKLEHLERFAQSLGLTAESLRRLGVGWLAAKHAWGFPMRDAAGDVVGVRLRLPGGRKLSVRGGREGLFLPDGLQPDGRLLMAEGPTDAAALLDLGFQAVGRPSCMGGGAHVVALVKRLRPADVVIVADTDAPGQRGAEALASTLAAYCGDVRVITPPSGLKDARAWRRAGGTAGDVQAAIDAARVWRLPMRVRTKAGGQNGRR